jgi:hypothetical protein
MNCHKWISELVECARTESPLSAELRAHLKVCTSCEQRWANQRSLSAQFRTMRDAARAPRQPGARREQIMREFEAAHRSAFHPQIKWVLSAAAVLILAILLGYGWRNGRHSTRMTAANASNIPQASASSSRQTSRVPAPPDGVSETEDMESANVEELADDNGFVAVPYTPPLAAGEFVRVIRTQFHPIALARMGVDVDLNEASEIPADVLVGEDGFPRAVRVLQF